jgi:hypothetical protein
MDATAVERALSRMHEIWKNADPVLVGIRSRGVPWRATWR